MLVVVVILIMVVVARMLCITWRERKEEEKKRQKREESRQRKLERELRKKDNIEKKDNGEETVVDITEYGSDHDHPRHVQYQVHQRDSDLNGGVGEHEAMHGLVDEPPNVIFSSYDKSRYCRQYDMSGRSSVYV